MHRKMMIVVTVIVIVSAVSLTTSWRTAHPIIGDLYEQESPSFIDINDIPGLDLGVPGMMGAVMWMNLTNIYGKWILARAMSENRYRWIAHYAEAIHQLTPQYMDPVLFASDAIAMHSSEVTASHRMLLRAFEANSGDWRIPFRLGFLYYRNYGDPRKAAHWWAVAANFPKSPDYLANLSQMIMLREYGEVTPMLGLLLTEDSTIPLIEQERHQMMEFVKLKRVLDQELENARQQTGRAILDPAEMVQLGFWLGIPRDPWDGEIRIHPDTGKVTASYSAPLFLKTWDTVPVDPALDRGEL